MKKYALIAASAVALAVPAQAADLIYVSVTGPTGTVWDTNSGNSYYAVFLQRPIGNLLNPNDNFSGSPTTPGTNNFLIAGDGYPSGTSENSDLLYNLTLRFADGAEISGEYNFSVPGGTFVNGTSATVGNMTYTLNGFGWDRSRADNVSPFRAVSGGDPFDYTGQFSYTAALGAVPEPATWGLFILGFGAIGGTLRRRNASIRKVRAKLNFA